MATTGGKKAFLAKVRGGGKEAPAPAKKVVNASLEAMLNSMMQQATEKESQLSFEQKMAIGSLVLKLEAVRNKISDQDYGLGFRDDSPLDGFGSDNGIIPDDGDGSSIQ